MIFQNIAQNDPPLPYTMPAKTKNENLHYVQVFKMDNISPASFRTICGLSILSSKISGVVSPDITKIPVMPAFKPHLMSV
jgi:hypothetical protein